MAILLTEKPWSIEKRTTLMHIKDCLKCKSARKLKRERSFGNVCWNYSAPVKFWKCGS